MRALAIIGLAFLAILSFATTQASADDVGSAIRKHAQAAAADTDTDAAEKPERVVRQASPAQIKEYEAKLSQLDKKVEQAKEMVDKLPKLQEHITAQLGKMTDGAGKPIDVAAVQKDLADKKASPATRKYHALMMDLVKFNQQISNQYLSVYVTAHRMDVDDVEYADELTSRRQAIEEAAAKSFVSSEINVAGLLARLGETAALDQTYTRILAVDKTNSQAQTHFKEKEEKQKAGNDTKDSGGGSRGNPSRGGYSR